MDGKNNKDRIAEVDNITCECALREVYAEFSLVGGSCGPYCGSS